MQSVCKFVCNPCVCLCAIRVCVYVGDFYCRLRVLGACLNKHNGVHFTCVFTLEITCSIRVCVLGGHSVPLLRGETQIDLSAGRRTLRKGGRFIRVFTLKVA